DIVFKTTFDYIAGQGLQKAVTYKHKNGLPSTAALHGVVHKASSPIELISLQGAYERTFVDPISREQFIDYIKVAIFDAEVRQVLTTMALENPGSKVGFELASPSHKLHWRMLYQASATLTAPPPLLPPAKRLNTGTGGAQPSSAAPTPSVPFDAAVTAAGNKVFDKALFDTAVPRSCYAWQMCGHCNPATCKMMAYGDTARRLADYPRTHALGCAPTRYAEVGSW
ncbi:hypothetical protein T492DRAFT_868081, partial [Pavlovales sp. CCMP2436]